MEYRREVRAFHRFTMQHDGGATVTEAAFAAWVKTLAARIPLGVVVRARTINGVPDALAGDGVLSMNSVSALRDRYVQRRTEPFVRAMASAYQAASTYMINVPTCEGHGASYVFPSRVALMLPSAQYAL